MQQTSSANVTWDGELQRVVQWLNSKKRQREQQQTSIFARVNTHLQFVHAQKRDREQEAEEDFLGNDGDSADSDDDEGMPDADLALEFLDGVNAEDIKSLLEAEAVHSASGEVQPAGASDNTKTPNVETVNPPEPNMLALIEMPSHLLEKNSPPKLYASPAKHVQLQPKFVVPPPLRLSPSATTKKVHVSSLTSIQLDEDSGVTELMSELDLDISDVAHHLPPESAHHSDHEEHKSEKNTPPHLKASQHSQTNDQVVQSSNTMEVLKQSVFSDAAKKMMKKSRNVVRDGSDESGDEAGRPVENARSAQRPVVDPDEVGAEMHSWVTGYRDPEVLQRKEAMAQRNRRPTARFGVNSVEEQRYINKAAKYYAEGKDAASSDSESSGGFGSDFSPDEVDDQDDPVSDVELLSDDYLDEDAEKAAASSKGKPCRRLRNQHKDSKKSTKKAGSKQRSKKSTSTVKGANNAAHSPAKANGAVGTNNVNKDSAKVNGSASSTPDRAKPSSNGHENETIDLLSSDDESDGSAITRVTNRSNPTIGRIPRATDATSQVRTKEKDAMILRLNLPKSMRESASLVPATTSAQPVSQGTEKAVNNTPRQLFGAHAGAASDNGANPSAKENVDNGNKTQLRSADVTTVDNGGDTSDAGTADFEMDVVDDTVEDDGDKKVEQLRASVALAASSSEVDRVESAKASTVSADLPRPREAARPAAEKTPNTPSTKESDKKMESTVTAVSLSEASLAKHNVVENAKTPQPNEIGKLADANKDDESEAETLDFDDVEEDLSDDADFEFGGDEGTTSRQEDLGFSDDDSGASDEKPGVAAPHDDDYEQFFIDTPLRKLKVKQKQQQEQKQSAEAKSAQAKPTEKPTDSTKNAKSPGPKAAAVPANGAKNKSPVTAAAKEPIGSNGLRKATKPAAIATSIVLKGKFQYSRRSIQVIDDGVEKFVNGKRSSSLGVYAVGTTPGVKKSRFSEPLVQNQEIHSSTRLTQDFISSISTPEKRQQSAYDQRGASKSTNGSRASEKPQDDGEERYLSYGGKSNGSKSNSYNSDDEPLSTSVRGTKGSRSGEKHSSVGSSSPPERSQSSSWSFSSAVTSSNENVDSNPKTPKFPRDRQLDIYDALHIESQGENGLTSRDLRDGEYKRPSAFKKVQDEKEKRGISFVPREKFMENAPIPKKKKVAGLPAKAPTPASDDKRSNGSDKRSARQKDNHYGPSSGEPVSTKKKSYSERSNDSKLYSSSSHKGKGKHSKNDKSKLSRRSPSPLSRRRSNDSDNHRFSSSHSSRAKEDNDRGRRRDHSRSRSPMWKHDRYVDESSRKRYRSLSRSKSRDRDERSSRSSRNDDRGGRFGSSSKDSREFDDKKREKSPSADDRTSSESRKRTRSLDRNDDKHSVFARKKESEDRDQRYAKKAKPVDPRVRAPQKDNNGGCVEDKKSSGPLPGTLFDSGSDMYISDSDGELDESDLKTTDIRFDLESVQVDQRQLKRRVYVSGINGMMDEEVLEELFAPFGIETDRESGFPSIDVFLCQRSLRPRGDACVTFAAEDGAINAVEEINAKIVKNCQIEVRRMDFPTQRVLNAQFLSPRESWKCVGAECRADVSIWNNKCDKCFRKRMFGPSRVRISGNDWLCSICFTANGDLSTGCHTCNASLPPTNRAQFYKN